MRLIAERLLPNAAGKTYVDNELISRTFRPLPPPKASYHVYASALNPGALALMEELAKVSQTVGMKCDISLSLSRGRTHKHARRVMN